MNDVVITVVLEHNCASRILILKVLKAKNKNKNKNARLNVIVEHIQMSNISKKQSSELTDPSVRGEHFQCLCFLVL